jgi:hypothetical protein
MLKTTLGLMLAVAVGVAAVEAIPETRSDLIAHEWGTFTTVAGADGRAVAWRPLDGPQDLPCFVERAVLPAKLSLRTTVRMETPVIYFHAARPATVDVSVRFHEGLMTEFFPRPTSSGPGRHFEGPNRLEWNHVQVTPGAALAFPEDGTTNHYYAARAAEANPLRVGNQNEGFLFYRGVGGFELPLRATASPSGDIDVINNGSDPIAGLMLFENRRGRIGYRTTANLAGRITLPAPGLDADVASVRASLVSLLIEQGLYPKEAAAMVETWSDSWFEEGTRLFYVVPKRLVDRTLPLDIRPIPGSIERVFVGRLEMATNTVLDDLRRAIVGQDQAQIAAFGRFLEPFSKRLLDGDLMPSERARISAEVETATRKAMSQAAQSRAKGPCATTTAPSAG